MRLVFLGSGAFGLPTLQALAREHNVLAVVSQPDKPAGRGMKLTPTPIAQWAADNLPGVPLHKPADINEPSIRDTLRALNADAWVVIAFGQKLGQPLLDGVFAINLHASLLPRWRGAAPINAAILAGDETTGNSVITLADRMDAGLILGTSTRPIEPTQTAGELHDALSADGPSLVLEVLHRKSLGSLDQLKQDESKVTKARKLSRTDGVLDFAHTATALRCKTHGLTPWPGVTVTLHHQLSLSPPPPVQLKLLRVIEADETHSPRVQPGEFIDVAKGLVACGDGTTLQLLDVQPAGSKPMLWEAFIRGAGRGLAPGARLA
jgi:methionyl-tRNA formyltransferase